MICCATSSGRTFEYQITEGGKASLDLSGYLIAVAVNAGPYKPSCENYDGSHQQKNENASDSAAYAVSLQNVDKRVKDHRHHNRDHERNRHAGDRRKEDNEGHRGKNDADKKPAPQPPELLRWAIFPQTSLFDRSVFCWHHFYSPAQIVQDPRSAFTLL